MRLGVWGARADRRGLAVQTGELVRHLNPSAVVGLDLTSDGLSPFPCDWTDIRGSAESLRVVARSDLDRQDWDWLASQCDVVWAAETTYLDEVPDWARGTGTPLVVTVNPEFCRYWTEPIPRPDLILTPTSWLVDRMPGVEVLATPVARDRLTWRQRPLDGPPTFLHVVGKRAAHDRNGTLVVVSAMKRITKPCRVILRSQERLRTPKLRNRHVHVDVRVEDVADYWRLYDDADVLVMPRRYGGQCLSMQEALSCGMPVIMSDVPPNPDVLPPDLLIPAVDRRGFQTQAGPVPIAHPDPNALARVMDRLSSDPDELARWSTWADRWADAHSWETLRPVYLETFARVADRRPVP